MKPRQMPQQTLARLTDLQERVENLERDAASAESEVARLRSLLRSNSGNPASLDEINAAKASFDAVFTAAQLARSKATAQAKLLAGVKSWLAGLGANVKLVLVHPEIGTASLAEVRGELAALRSDLSKLRANPPADLHIDKRIADYVAELARRATPRVTGFCNGGVLDVKWPGDIYDPNQNTALLLMAAIQPAELSELIFRSVVAAQPLSAQQHSEKMLSLTSRLAALSYVEAALVERTSGEHSVETDPWCLLGVRIERQENAAA